MQSPLLGFNNNVKHRGRLFHIQTEDSGVKHPHVITHLFMDGGRILKSVKTSYAEHIGSERLFERVRELMKSQHKTMFIALRDGQFDHVLDGESGAASSKPASGANAARADAAPSSEVASSTMKEVAAKPAIANEVPLAAPRRSSTGGMPSPARPSTSGMPAPTRRSTGGMPAPSRPSTGGMPAPSRPSTGGMPAPSRPSTGGMPAPSHSVSPTAASAAPAVAARTGRREAPELFGRAAEEAAVNVVTEDASKPKKEKPSSGRYVASRPAAIFTSGRTPEAGGSIFGDDLISEKSLDEVILSYLSEDLETSSSKK